MDTRRSILAVSFALAATLFAPAFAGDPVGPPIGEAAPTFDVDDITGPNKGKALCYV